MKSAFECFQHAAQCEHMANNSKDEANRTVLLATARHWRALGEKAKASEGQVGRQLHSVAGNSFPWPEKSNLTCKSPASLIS
jgi:hypothetical protein